MKFRSPKFKRLRVHGVGQFVDGVLETDDPAAMEKIEAIAERYDVQAVRDSSDPFDPSAHGRDTVNRYLATATEAERIRVLDAEAAGKARVTILRGPHGVTGLDYQPGEPGESGTVESDPASPIPGEPGEVDTSTED